MFVADDLGAWLIGLLADRGRKKLTTVLVGTDQERALRSAATAAVQRTVSDLRPGNTEQAQPVALVISQVFGQPGPNAPLAEHQTVLDALQEGIATQLAVLDDASLTGIGRSSADVLGVPAAVLADRLTGYLLGEIITRGSRGGPLFPMASQLNHDLSRTDSQQIKTMVGQVLQVLARLDTARATAAPTALDQLPRLVAGFTGRDDELAVLAGLLNPAGSARTPGPVVISAVAGMAGVGKTALAVQAGHAARNEGWFGGGVLFIDLHGYDTPVEPGQALDALLRALGVAAEHIPPSVEERAALYRSILARVTDPVLIIIDNASSEAQVKPLLAGTGPHKVLVTSRQTLARLGARLVDVTVLDQQAAIELLDTALRSARPDDGRLCSDQQAARQLAAACGGLPLALQITAALLIADPALSAGMLADELTVESERLERLRYDDGSGADVSSVAVAFELSYRRLGETQALMFRLLPVIPSPDVSTATAGILADMPVSGARQVLGDLARAHLIEVAPGISGRWRMHDLVRLYAQRLSEEHADPDGHEQAIDRLLGYYAKMADAADDQLRALSADKAPAAFAGLGEALAWLDAERATLVAAVRVAASTGRNRDALRLPVLLGEYFNRRQRFDDWIACAEISVTAARLLGDRRHEGDALTALGLALVQAGRFGEAITAQRAAAAIHWETGNRRGSGMALNNLGLALRHMGQVEEAITVHLAAIGIDREAGDRRGEASALNNLGIALSEAGLVEDAITAGREAVAIYREAGDRHGEASALNSLGSALRQAGLVQEAITAQRASAAVFGESGDRHGEGSALTNLGNTLRQAGLVEEAITACHDAVAIHKETGDRHEEGLALGNLGLALRQAGLVEEAITACQDAAAIFRETGDQQREEMALRDLERARAEHG